MTLDTPSSAATKPLPACRCACCRSALRGLSLVEVLQMNVTALQTLLPRVTEPPLLKNEVANMDPADLVALGTEVVAFGAEGWREEHSSPNEDAMAGHLALVFRRQPADMDPMAVGELMTWRERAREYERQE